MVATAFVGRYRILTDLSTIVGLYVWVIAAGALLTVEGWYAVDSFSYDNINSKFRH